MIYAVITVPLKGAHLYLYSFVEASVILPLIRIYVHCGCSLGTLCSELSMLLPISY